MNVLLTGGGTGGHIYPALAITQALRAQPEAQDLKLLYVGTRERLEARIVPKAGLPIAYVCAAPLQRQLSLGFLRTLARTAVGIVQALGVLHAFRPDCVVATGGYVTFPVVVAMRLARTLGLTRGKIALLEPNARAGLTNRLLKPLVDEMWTDMPVRAEFSQPFDPRVARARLRLDPEKTTIVVMGGSQGARSLNQAVAGLDLPQAWQILHLTGDADGACAATKPNVVRLAYLEEPWLAYAAADVVVARAGASTLAELAATGTPAILVPYPHASDAHQMHNAMRCVREGTARLIEDHELTPERLLEEIRSALEPDTFLALCRAGACAQGRDARERIARRIVVLASEKPR